MEQSTVELAQLVEPVAPGCAESIKAGESDLSQYPAADLSVPEIAEFYGVTSAASCGGLLASLYFIEYTTREARLLATVASAWLGCGLDWIESIQYVYGPNWIIDAPWWTGFPGDEVAQLTQGTFNHRSCEAFEDAYTQELGDEFIVDLGPNVSQDVMRLVLGEG